MNPIHNNNKKFILSLTVAGESFSWRQFQANMTEENHLAWLFQRSKVDALCNHHFEPLHLEDTWENNPDVCVHCGMPYRSDPMYVLPVEMELPL